MTEPPLPWRLERGDLPKEAVALARALIGKSLVHELSDGPAGVRIVETEAYPVGDPAGLAFRGPTKHNAPLFMGSATSTCTCATASHGWSTWLPKQRMTGQGSYSERGSPSGASRG
jgi:3-methyladenine DNA glycosylase Mpg